MKIFSPTPASSRTRRARRGMLEMDLAAALALLALVIVPIGFAIQHERRFLHAEYARSAVAELVDGEAEILAAGAARPYPDGTQPYPVAGPTVMALPPGHFQLTKHGRQASLAWLPDAQSGVSTVTREFTVK